jgi:hypothetical protein
MYRTKIERNFQAVGPMTLFLLPVKMPDNFVLSDSGVKDGKD